MTNHIHKTKKEFSSLTKFAMVFGAVVFSVFLFMGVQVFSETRIGLTLFSNPDLEDGLVGHWTFDGPDMISNVADRSGQGNHGSLIHGGSGTTTSPGTLGQALEFDGSDDYVSVSDSASLDIENAVTMAMWVKFDSVEGSFPRLLQKGQNTAYEIYISGATPILRINNSDFSATNDLKTGEWMHVTITYNSDTDSAAIYYDGEEDATGTITTTSIGTNNDPLRIFTRETIDSFINGTLDDVRIYNRALSADEISRLYDLGATTHINTTITTNPDLEDGLVGHWTFDGPDMISNVADRSGQGNDGALQGQTSTSTAPGAIGQALDFDGTDDYVDMGNPVEMQITGNITVSAWIKTTDTDTSAILSKWDDSGSSDERAILFAVDNGGKVRFTLDASGTFSTVVNSYSSNTVSDDKWHHVIGVYDGSSAKVYVDGVEKGSNSYSSDIYNTPTNWEAGAMSDGSEWYFGGAIDDARIYNRALSADEISRLYDLGATTHINTTITTNPNLENGLVGHWSFDGPDMISNVADRSGQGNDGALQGQTSTSTAPGAIGQALEFDGSDDYVDAGLFDLIEGSSEITISLWAKQGSHQQTAYVNKNDNAGFQLQPWDDSKIYWAVNGATDRAVTAAGVYPLNEWYHVVGTYDGATLKIFVNTDEKASTNKSTTIPSDAESLLIGFNSNGNFNGQVDDVRIYNRALSADEVQRLYNLGR